MELVVLELSLKLHLDNRGQVLYQGLHEIKFWSKVKLHNTCEDCITYIVLNLRLFIADSLLLIVLGKECHSHLVAHFSLPALIGVVRHVTAGSFSLLIIVRVFLIHRIILLCDFVFFNQEDLDLIQVAEEASEVILFVWDSQLLGSQEVVNLLDDGGLLVMSRNLSFVFGLGSFLVGLEVFHLINDTEKVIVEVLVYLKVICFV